MKWLINCVQFPRCIFSSSLSASVWSHTCLCVCVSPLQQEKGEMKRELWRIEDVMAGLSTSKANYKITIDSVQNPGRLTEQRVHLRDVVSSLGVNVELL